jgi:hypothetical protein
MIRTYLHIVIVFLVLGCEERVTNLATRDGKISIECELNPSESIVAKVTELNDFDKVNRNSKVEDITLRLSTGIDEEISFTYDPIHDVYFVPKNLHTVRSGSKYNLIAFRASNEEIQYRSQTFTPGYTKLAGKVTSFENENIGDLVGKKVVKINCAVPDAVKDNFYLLSLKMTKNNNAEDLIFTGYEDDPLAFQVSSIDNGILIDLNRVKNNNNFDLSFITSSNVKPNDKLGKITYTLCTLTESTYRYRISKSKQNIALKNGASSPVITYTNVTNGYGYLGSNVPYSDTIAFSK